MRMMLCAVLAAAATGDSPSTGQCTADGGAGCKIGNVRDRELVKKRVSPDDILQHHDKPGEIDAKRFPRSTLGIITPWHSDGPDVAMRFAPKFDYISPLWFHITPQQATGESDGTWTVKVHPTGNPDKGWVHELRKKGPKVVPIFAFYGWSQKSLSEYFIGKKSGTVQHETVRQMVAVCKEVDCNGIHIEWGAMPMNDFYYKLDAWLRRLRGTMRKHLQAHQQDLFLSVHPDPSKFGKTQFDALITQTVDKVIYHIYNFTGPALAEGPNAPIGWFNEMIGTWRLDTRTDFEDKVIVMLNFFGREYRADFGLAVDDFKEKGDGVARDEFGDITRWDITGRDYISILNAAKAEEDQRLKIDYDSGKKEHELEYYPLVNKFDKGRQMREHRKVYFPSLKSISKRIDRLSELRTCGMGVYNLGTGLDYFYDLI